MHVFFELFATIFAGGTHDLAVIIDCAAAITAVDAQRTQE
jgi:hypothetical protein